LLTLRIFKLLLELIDFSLKLELLELGGEFLHTLALWSIVLGGVLATGAIILGWNDFYIIPGLRHGLSK
jgi:hypothetical protein